MRGTYSCAIFSVLVLFVFGIANGVGASAHEVAPFAATPAQLERIALVAIELTEPMALRLPGFSVTTGGQPPDSDGYYLFEADWSGSASGGSSNVAFLLINRYDGDVWNETTCKHLKSRKISLEQKKLIDRARIENRKIINHLLPKCSREK